MKSSALRTEIVAQLNHLKLPQQKQVLGFIYALTTHKGVRGDQLLPFIGTISLDDLKKMAEVIEQDCERIDQDEW